MKTITLKGRKIPLLYTTWEMKTIQEEIGPLHIAIPLVMGRNPDDENDDTRYGGADHLLAAAKLVKILGNAGLEEAGENPDLTEKKILRSMKPADLADVLSLCMDAMADGMASEIPEEEEKGPVDVTLEEMNKKKEQES